MLQTRQESIADDRKILVIEDSRTFSLALRQFLEAETGLPVTTCGSLKDLSELIVAAPGAYAIAVVDLNLPDAPRGEALDWTVTHGIPSVVFTATFDLTTRGRIMEREVIDYVLKDNELALPNLVATVKRALDNHNTRILVVDDTRTTRKVLARMLAIQQYALDHAEIGQEALAILGRKPLRRLLDDTDRQWHERRLQRPPLRRQPDMQLAAVGGIALAQDETALLHAGDGAQRRRLHRADPVRQLALGEPVFLPECA